MSLAHRGEKRNPGARRAPDPATVAGRQHAGTMTLSRPGAVRNGNRLRRRPSRTVGPDVVGMTMQMRFVIL
mgnify:CR=1 FL=1